MKGWGVSVLVGWTDLYDFAARPIQLIAGRTWKGSLFGGESPHTVTLLSAVSVVRNDLAGCHPNRSTSDDIPPIVDPLGVGTEIPETIVPAVL